MAVTPKQLGLVKITSTTEKSLLTVFSDPPWGGGGQPPIPKKSVFITSVMLTNETGSETSVEVYVRGGSNSTKYFAAPKPLKIPANSQITLDTELTLLQNTANYEVLYGALAAGSTSAVTFIVNGFERDA
jgi:hypothetical protein